MHPLARGLVTRYGGKLALVGAVACAALLAACSSAPPRPAPLPVTPLQIATDRGVVVGKLGEGVREFLAIPYAAPPTGANRWRPPAPVPAWTGLRDASRRGPACPQPEEGYHRETSEDCLTLNVWIPDHAGEALPVLFWIHGGGFYQGSGGDDLYDGARLARRARAIVVTINYRLGALGFFSQRALAAELGRPALPSLGLLDQRAALQWVQRNIAAFGGDPRRVILDGESAGAWSIYSHLAMPGSRGLFAGAIVQSGASADALYFTPDEIDAQGEQLAQKLGCTGDDARVAACLRGKSADELVNALPYRRGLLLQPGVWWGPTVDGAELPRLPLEAIRAGDFARVPLILGSARDEGTLHTAFLETVTDDDLAWFLTDSFGAEAAAGALARYRAGPYAQDRKLALDHIVNDGIFHCNARRTARAAAAHGVPVYLYEWAHALDAPPQLHALGATHGIDLFFVFGAVVGAGGERGLGAGPAEQPLVELTQDLWGSFVRSGAPSAGATPWPRYTAERDQHFVLDDPASTGTGLAAARCDFWDSLAR